MEEMTKIKFYAGLRTIGGTIVSIEYGKNRIIFDFGRAFKPLGTIIDNGYEKLEDPVKEYIRLGLLPEIDGIYGESSIPQGKEIVPFEKFDKATKVFISHLHLDHMELMGMIDKRVPVLMTKDGLNLYNTLKKVGESVKGEREFSSFEYDETITMGDIKVTALKIEHDVLGACSLFIETPDLKIIYTGDLRMDGMHPEWTLGMAEKANELGCNLLISESTTIGKNFGENYVERDNRVTEKDVREAFRAVMEETEGIVLFNIYNRNVARIAEIYEAAKAAGRRLVLEPSTAFIASSLTGVQNFSVFENENIEDVSSEVTASISKFDRVTIEDINKDPKKYLLQNSFDNILLLLKLNTKNGLYIHSNGTPLGDYDPNYAAMRDLINKLSLKYRYIGASGHAKPEDLKFIAEKIAPKWFIPLHGFYPENFKISSGIRLLPEEGREYFFKDGNLINNM